MANTVGYYPETGEWNDSLTGDYLWSSVNTREATPDITTPYTWSALRFGFAQMTMLPGYSPVGNICGRVYNNASVGQRPFRRSGAGIRSTLPARNCMASIPTTSARGMCRLFHADFGSGCMFSVMPSRSWARSEML